MTKKKTEKPKYISYREEWIYKVIEAVNSVMVCYDRCKSDGFKNEECKQALEMYMRQLLMLMKKKER